MRELQYELDAMEGDVDSDDDDPRVRISYSSRRKRPAKVTTVSQMPREIVNPMRVRTSLLPVIRLC